MGKFDAIEKAHVLQALAEFDSLGREVFLKKYGRGPSRSYFLRHNHKLYDSKAVAAAAYGFARPDEGPLQDFAGGLRTVKRALGDNLGFEFAITGDKPPEDPKLPAEWASALQRVKQAKQNAYYMPAAILVALDMIEDGELEASGAIRFAPFKGRFEALLSEADPDGRRNAQAPFFYLSKTASVWSVTRPDNVTIESDSRVNAGCLAHLSGSLAPACHDPELREIVYQHVYSIAPGPLAACHRYQRSRRGDLPESDLWALCSTLLGLYPQEKGSQPELSGTRSFELSKQIQEEALTLSASLVPSPFWEASCSIGVGNWSDVPWFSVFDRRETTSAKRGVYVVGHFGFDGQHGAKLRLGFGVAATEFKRAAPEKAKEVLEQVDSWSRKQLAARGLLTAPSSPIGTYGRLGQGYDAGMVAALVLDADQVEREEAELTDNLRLLLACYQTWVDGQERERDPDDDSADSISSLSQAIDALHGAAMRRSLSYSRELLQALLLSLKTKPFCLLAGATGTGKSRLARLLGELGAVVRVEPVEPSWTDGTSVVGYRDLDQVFRPGVLTAHAQRASADPTRPYVLVLDELNLARVEHYLAQWLSVIESRTLASGAVVADPLFQDEGTLVSLPANLMVIGTVNMDESTFAFSQRVLDRANTLALPSPVVLLPGDEASPEPDPSASSVEASVFFPRALAWQDLRHAASPEHFAEIRRVTEVYFEPTQRLLVEHAVRARISFRLRDEMCAYVLHGLETGSATAERLVDQQLLQRVLPKVCDGYSRLSEKFVEAVRKAWRPLGVPAPPAGQTSAELLKLVFQRQQEADMPVSLWTALA